MLASLVPGTSVVYLCVRGSADWGPAGLVFFLGYRVCGFPGEMWGNLGFLFGSVSWFLLFGVTSVVDVCRCLCLGVSLFGGVGPVVLVWFGGVAVCSCFFGASSVICMCVCVSPPPVLMSIDFLTVDICFLLLFVASLFVVCSFSVVCSCSCSVKLFCFGPY